MGIEKILQDVPSLIDEKKYYELLGYENRNIFCPGQIVKAFISYPIQQNLKILYPHDIDSIDSTKTTYKLEDFSYEKLESTRHRPIAGDSNLEWDECYIVQKGKPRSCVILNCYQSRFNNSRHDEKIYLCAPIFSIKQRHSDQFLLDILSFNIPSEFFLPKNQTGLDSHSVIRFSRILPLYGGNMKAKESNSMGNKPFKLSSNVYKLLVYHLANYFSFDYEYAKSISPEIDTFREIIKECRL